MTGVQTCALPILIMDADKDNIASWKTMESLGGINTKVFLDTKHSNTIVKDYEFDVEKSLKSNLDKYEMYIEDEYIKQ